MPSSPARTTLSTTKHVTDLRKHSLFALVDKDHSGTIDEEEFDKLYCAIRAQTEEDLREKIAAENKATQTARRFKVLALGFGVLFLFLGLSVASNLIMMIHIVDAAVPTKSGVGGQLISKSTGDSTHGMWSNSCCRDRGHELRLLPPHSMLLLTRLSGVAVAKTNPALSKLSINDLALDKITEDDLEKVKLLMATTADGTKDVYQVVGYTITGKDSVKFYTARGDTLIYSRDGGINLEIEHTDGRRRRLGANFLETVSESSHANEIESCHPAHSTVELAKAPSSFHRIRMDALSVGDHIRTPSGVEPVVGFLHAEERKLAEYFVFTTEANLRVAIAQKHFLYVDGVEADPATVTIGQALSTPNGPQTITTIAKEVHMGAYHPITPSGAYYVDGVAASTYLSNVPRAVFKIFGDGYITLRYRLGLPLVPLGVAPINIFWFHDILIALSVPVSIRSSFMWPVVVGSAAATELACAVGTKMITVPSILATVALVAGAKQRVA